MSNEKTQISMEYLSLIGFIAVILVPLFLLYYTSLKGTGDEIYSRQALSIARKIADAADSVYFLGEPSQTKIRINMPSNIDSIAFNENSIIVRMKVSGGITEVVQIASVNLTGSLPTDPGQYTIIVKAIPDNEVEISYT